MGCGFLSFLAPRGGNCGPGGCPNARAAGPVDLPVDPPAWQAPPPDSPSALGGDAGILPALGELAGIGLPGEAPVGGAVRAAAPPAPQGGGPLAAAPAPQGGGFFDDLLRGVRDMFRPAPQNPGLRNADAAVANVGRQGGQVLDNLRGVVDQAFATGRGILDRVVGFMRGLFGDVDRLIQNFRRV